MRFNLIWILLFSTSFGYSQSKCDAVREGSFYTLPNEKKNQPRISIERTAFSQFEQIGEEEPIQYAVRWIDECKFVLEKTMDEELVRLVVTIEKVKKKFYTYSATRLGMPIVTGKLYRKKQ